MSVFNISTWSLVINFTGSLSKKKAALLAKLKGKFKKYLFNSISFNKKINISLKLRMSGPPTSKIWPFLNCLFIQATMILTKSDTNIGWNFVFPPPIKGINGDNLHIYNLEWRHIF